MGTGCAYVALSATSVRRAGANETPSRGSDQQRVRPLGGPARSARRARRRRSRPGRPSLVHCDGAGRGVQREELSPASCATGRARARSPGRESSCTWRLRSCARRCGRVHSSRRSAGLDGHRALVDAGDEEPVADLERRDDVLVAGSDEGDAPEHRPGRGSTPRIFRCTWITSCCWPSKRREDRRRVAGPSPRSVHCSAPVAGSNAIRAPPSWPPACTISRPSAISGDIEAPNGGAEAGKRPAKSFCQSDPSRGRIEGGEDPADAEGEEPAAVDYGRGPRTAAVRGRPGVDVVGGAIALAPQDAAALAGPGRGRPPAVLAAEQEGGLGRRRPGSPGLRRPRRASVGQLRRPGPPRLAGGRAASRLGPRHCVQSAVPSGSPTQQQSRPPCSSACVPPPPPHC